MSTCAFVGLGVMGYPMAGHLMDAGYATTVYNRTLERAEDWVEQYKGVLASTPAEASIGAEVVMLCVGNDNDVRAVVYGEDGVLAGMSEGSVLVDHTTASAELARELGKATADRGIGFIDAPISGGQVGAENGHLSVMCGGDLQIFERIKSIIDAYAKAIVLVGPVGHGQLTKMVNQVCIGGLVQGLAEALNFSRKAGLDTDKVLEAISQGASASWYLSNRSQSMLDRKFDHGFAIDWMRKDFSIVFDEAQRINSRLPVTELIDKYYGDLQDMGYGRWDVSSLIELLHED